MNFGYTCAECKQWVTHGTFHTCTNVLGSTGVSSTTFYFTCMTCGKVYPSTEMHVCPNALLGVLTEIRDALRDIASTLRRKRRTFEGSLWED